MAEGRLLRWMMRDEANAILLVSFCLLGVKLSIAILSIVICVEVDTALIYFVYYCGDHGLTSKLIDGRRYLMEIQYGS